MSKAFWRLMYKIFYWRERRERKRFFKEFNDLLCLPGH